MSTEETIVLETEKKARQPHVKLSPQEVRGLYYLKERHVEDIIEAAVRLEEQERKLVLSMMDTLLTHRRSRLS
ncbi:MAG: hypothetical protein ACFE0R_16205 [Salinarimonas sp.]